MTLSSPSLAVSSSIMVSMPQNVKLKNVVVNLVLDSSTYSNNIFYLNFMLTGPHGQQVILMSNAGGNLIRSNTMGSGGLTFDDTATCDGVSDWISPNPDKSLRALPAICDLSHLGNAAIIPPSITNTIATTTTITPGTYRPAKYNPGDPNVQPGPTLSSFNGSDPSGIWTLYIWDDKSPPGINQLFDVPQWSLTLSTTPFVITSNDDGLADTFGTLSYALANIKPAESIAFALPQGQNTVAITGTRPLTVPNGISLVGSCDSSGPRITIDGSGVNPGTRGLILGNNDTIQGLRITGFGGSEIKNTGRGNKLKCVEASNEKTVFNLVQMAPKATWVTGSTANTNIFVIGFNGPNENEPNGYANWIDNTLMSDGSRPIRALETHPLVANVGPTGFGYIVGFYTSIRTSGYTIQPEDRIKGKIKFRSGKTQADARFDITTRFFNGNVVESTAVTTLLLNYGQGSKSFDIPLKAYAGKTNLDFSLTILSQGPADQDWAVWQDVKVVR